MAVLTSRAVWQKPDAGACRVEIPAKSDAAALSMGMYVCTFIEYDQRRAQDTVIVSSCNRAAESLWLVMKSTISCREYWPEKHMSMTGTSGSARCARG